MPIAIEIMNGMGLAPCGGGAEGVGGGDFDSVGGDKSEEEGSEVILDLFWGLWCAGDFLRLSWKESVWVEGELKGRDGAERIGWKKWGRKELVHGERRAATSIVVQKVWCFTSRGAGVL